jgi:parvulin-like peptidyl-prolyl isomerase
VSPARKRGAFRYGACVVPKGFRLIAALGAVFFALFGLAACGGSGGVPGNAVVKVGDTPITNAAFKHWIGVAAISGASGLIAEKPAVPEPPEYKACIAHFKEVDLKEIATNPAAKKNKPLTEPQLKKQCEAQYKSYSQEVLAFLISSQWVISEASALGVKLTDAEIKKQFKKIKSQQFPKTAEFEKFLATSGQTVSDLLLRVKLNQLSTKIQQKVTSSKGKVTQAQIQKYYNDNKSRYETPEKRTASIILVKTETAAKKALAEVKGGKSFASVASRTSEDKTSKAKGGSLGEVIKGQEEKSLDEAIFSAPKNTPVGPVKSPFGYYVILVSGITAGTHQSLAQVSSSIKAQLTATKQQEALSKFVKEFKTRWKAKTDCRPAYVVANCKQYKAPKTATGKTGG